MNEPKNCGIFTQWNNTRSRKKEGAYILCNNMDGTGEHYAKFNKLGGERQIPYDLTYNWKLINKTNKQAKQNQRHWNKKHTDSNERGGGREIRGKKGKGSQRTCIKDPRTKPNGGRIESGRWQWVWWGRVVGKWRQMYLNFNKKWFKKLFSESKLVNCSNSEPFNLSPYFISLEFKTI